ncbi:hypothetical protein [Methanopyrus sp.]
MRTTLALLSLVLAAVGGAAAEEAPLYGVLTHPWVLQLSASQAKYVPKDYVISVEAPVNASLPHNKAYYGVFVADRDHAAVIVDLTPVVTGETDDAVVVDPNVTLRKPVVKFMRCKSVLGRGNLLALSLETKPLPLSMSLRLVKPEGLTVKVGKFQVKLDRELLEDLARVLAAYEYGRAYGKKEVPVGYLQALVFKNLVRASVMGAHKEKLETSEKGASEVSKEHQVQEVQQQNVEEREEGTTAETKEVTSATTTEKEIEKEVNEETGYALRAFLEVNERKGLTDLKAEFSVENLENLIGEAVAVLKDVLSSPEAQQAAATAEKVIKKSVKVPVSALCLLGIALVALRRR